MSLCLFLIACGTSTEEGYNSLESYQGPFIYPENPISPTLEDRISKITNLWERRRTGPVFRKKVPAYSRATFADAAFLEHKDANALLLPLSVVAGEDEGPEGLSCIFPPLLLSHFSEVATDNISESDPLSLIRYLFVLNPIKINLPSGVDLDMKGGTLSGHLYVYDLYQDEYLGNLFFYNIGEGQLYQENIDFMD